MTTAKKVMRKGWPIPHLVNDVNMLDQAVSRYRRKTILVKALEKSQRLQGSSYLFDIHDCLQNQACNSQREESAESRLELNSVQFQQPVTPRHISSPNKIFLWQTNTLKFASIRKFWVSHDLKNSAFSSFNNRSFRDQRKSLYWWSIGLRLRRKSNFWHIIKILKPW